MSGFVEKHIKDQETEMSRKFGNVSVANVVTPSGRLGFAEHKNHFEVSKQGESYTARLVQTSYIKDKELTVDQKNIPSGANGQDLVYGPFATRGDARTFVSNFIADYHGAAREHTRAGIEHQRSVNREEEGFALGIGM